MSTRSSLRRTRGRKAKTILQKSITRSRTMMTDAYFWTLAGTTTLKILALRLISQRKYNTQQDILQGLHDIAREPCSKQRSSVPHDLPYVLVIECGRILASSNLIEFWMSPCSRRRRNDGSLSNLSCRCRRRPGGGHEENPSSKVRTQQTLIKETV